MKPFTHIDQDLLDNAGEFDQAFFKAFPLREGARAIDLPHGIRKSYRFPTWYGNVTCAIAIFMCDYDKAAASLPDPAMRPVRMPRGRAVVTISNYIYRNVNGIPGYNEVAMTIPVILDDAAALPVLPLITDHPHKGYYVFSMPVTSLENQIRGLKFWGLPKSVQEICIEASGEHCRVHSIDEEGKNFFEITVPTTGKRKALREQGIICSILDGTLKRSVTTFAGDFHIQMRLGRLFSKAATVNQPHSGHAADIKLGDSVHADLLRNLDMEATPFQTRFAHSMNACFDLPLGTPGVPG